MQKSKTVHTKGYNLKLPKTSVASLSSPWLPDAVRSTVHNTLYNNVVV